MRVRALTTAVVIGILAISSAVLAAEQADRRIPAAGKGEKAIQFTPEQQAFLDQAKELRKQVRIARLELQLAEAKEAPEREIAQKAEGLYSLLGKEHAFRVKNREVAQQLRQRTRQEWRERRGRGAQDELGLGRGRGRGGGLGAGPGRGGRQGRGMGRGGRGFGRGRGAGMGLMPGAGGEQPGMGRRGEGRGRDMGGGRGMGRGRGGADWKTGGPGPGGREAYAEQTPPVAEPEASPAEERER